MLVDIIRKETKTISSAKPRSARWKATTDLVCCLSEWKEPKIAISCKGLGTRDLSVHWKITGETTLCTADLVFTRNHRGLKPRDFKKYLQEVSIMKKATECNIWFLDPVVPLNFTVYPVINDVLVTLVLRAHFTSILALNFSQMNITRSRIHKTYCRPSYPTKRFHVIFWPYPQVPESQRNRETFSR